MVYGPDQARERGISSPRDDFAKYENELQFFD